MVNKSKRESCIMIMLAKAFKILLCATSVHIKWFISVLTHKWSQQANDVNISTILTLR